MRNVGIFGGTFNPVHWGHLLIAETALTQFGLERVVWVPTFRPPHKSQVWLEFAQRLELVQRAIADHPLFTVSDVEAQRSSISYAIETLRDLQRLYPHANWFWIIGIDAFQNLPKWRGSKELIPQCTWLVAPRRMQQENAAHQKSVQHQETSRLEEQRESASNLIWQSQPLTINDAVYQWYPLQMPLIEISSSLVRQYCQEGRSIRYLVPESVRLYIVAHQFYK